MHFYTDGNCYEFTDILTYVLTEKSIRLKIINECIDLDKTLYNNDILKTDLLNLDAKKLVKTLLSGYIKSKKIFKYFDNSKIVKKIR